MYIRLTTNLWGKLNHCSVEWYHIHLYISLYICMYIKITYWIFTINQKTQVFHFTLIALFEPGNWNQIGIQPSNLELQWPFRYPFFSSNPWSYVEIPFELHGFQHGAILMGSATAIQDPCISSSCPGADVPLSSGTFSLLCERARFNLICAMYAE